MKADALLSAEVRRLAFPAIVHSLLQTLVFVVDRVMLGRHGDASLAAMQLGGAIEWSIWSVFASFEVGTIARVGRHVGARDPDSARRAAWLSIAMAVGIGTIVALGSPLLLAMLGRAAPSASAEVLGEARGYLGVTMAASPLVFLTMVGIATLQAGGDTRTPLAIGVFANVVHVAMNRALILGVGTAIPAMGAKGAGISTAITFALEAALACWALMRTSQPVSLRASARPKDEYGHGALVRAEARQLARIALPALFERILYHFGYLGYVFIIGRLGDAAMAANQSLISVESICFLSADGFGIAAAALVAQKIGANDPRAAQKVAWIAARDATLALTVFGLVALASRDVILPWFSQDGMVLGIGRRAMFVLALAQPFMAVGMVLAQALRGAGRTREALGVSVIGAVVVRLSATWILAITLGLGLTGVWLGSTLDWVVRSALLAWIASRSVVGVETARADDPSGARTYP